MDEQLVSEIGIYYTHSQAVGEKIETLFCMYYDRWNLTYLKKEQVRIYIQADSANRAQSYLLALVNHWNKIGLYIWKFTV